MHRNPRAAREVATRFIGTCGVCEREIKLSSSERDPGAQSSSFRLVHHGYQRPGDGQIHGDCFGVGREPYEVSPAATSDFLELVLSKMERAQIFLGRLQSGEITEIYKTTWSKAAPKLLTPADGWEFKDEINSRISQTKTEIRSLEATAQRLEALVQHWRRVPVRPVEERVSEQRERSEARAAERSRAAEARQAKRSAIDSKKNEREQERQQLLREYRVAFNELAFQGDAKAKREARVLWEKFWRATRKKAYLRTPEYELGINEALEALDLATPRESPHGNWTHWYADSYGYLRR